MTDKIKKLELLTDDVHPEFPSNRGGYVEDTVDEWLSNHLKEVNEIIKYQNYGVDVVDALEADLNTARERIAELESEVAAIPEPVVVTVKDEAAEAEVSALRSALAEANARIEELESATPAPAVTELPTYESETVQASILLQHATELGQKYIEQAKADGEQIRRDAEDKLVELRGDIEDLEAQRFATRRSLEEFFSQELVKLRENPLFAHEAAKEEESEEEAVEADEETPVVENDADAADEDAVVVSDEDEEDEISAAPALDEENDEELETNDLLDEESDEDSK